MQDIDALDEEDRCMTSPIRNNVFIVGKKKENTGNIPKVDARKIDEAARRALAYKKKPKKNAP